MSHDPDKVVTFSKLPGLTEQVHEHFVLGNVLPFEKIYPNQSNYLLYKHCL